jgi:replication factor C subunit 2/4
MSFVPWTEKYRPKTINDVKHQDEVVRMLNRSRETKSLPHLLLYGPPGTGKTSAILAIARDLFKSHFKEFVLELNASDERGIGIVRGKIKTFAQISISVEPRFKLIILDEADAMTADAQSALRRIMETYSGNTRFCLIGNYVSRIIEPLASRCAKFRFAPLSTISVSSQLRYIVDAEQVPMDDEVLTSVADVSGGDMRKAVTYLHSLCLLRPVGGATPDDVLAVAGAVPRAVADDLLTAARTRGTGVAQVMSVVEDIVLAGYPATAVLALVATAVATDPAVDDEAKARVALSLAQADDALAGGADELLQLLSVGTSLVEFIAA